MRLCVLWTLLFSLSLSNQSNAEDSIPVTRENYSAAEAARNYNNWNTMAGGSNKLLHVKRLGEIGPNAPTIRMNRDTLYSSAVVDNSNGSLTVTLPEADIYQSVMILDDGGFTPLFKVGHGSHTLESKSKYLWVVVRTAVENPESEKSLEQSLNIQSLIKISGQGSKPYVMPNYDQEKLEKLTTALNAEFVKSGAPFTYFRNKEEIKSDQQYKVHIRSQAAGFGGMAAEVGYSNSYVSSETMTGEVCRSITFEDPEDKYFTSFTVYSAQGYLMEGRNHISSTSWDKSVDGTITIRFNCGEGAQNDLSSNGEEFNYTIRNYGASQKVIDQKWNPVAPVIVK